MNPELLSALSPLFSAAVAGTIGYYAHRRIRRAETQVKEARAELDKSLADKAVAETAEIMTRTAVNLIEPLNRRITRMQKQRKKDLAQQDALISKLEQEVRTLSADYHECKKLLLGLPKNEDKDSH